MKRIIAVVLCILFLATSPFSFAEVMQLPTDDLEMLWDIPYGINYIQFSNRLKKNKGIETEHDVMTVGPRTNYCVWSTEGQDLTLYGVPTMLLFEQGVQQLDGDKKLITNDSRTFYFREHLYKKRESGKILLTEAYIPFEQHDTYDEAYEAFINDNAAIILGVFEKYGKPEKIEIKYCTSLDDWKNGVCDYVEEITNVEPDEVVDQNGFIDLEQLNQDYGFLSNERETTVRIIVKNICLSMRIFFDKDHTGCETTTILEFGNWCKPIESPMKKVEPIEKPYSDTGL